MSGLRFPWHYATGRCRPAVLTKLSTDEQWALAAQGDDVDEILKNWTDDAVIYAQGRPPVVGKEEIRRYITESRAKPGFSISWKPTRVENHGMGKGVTVGDNVISFRDPTGKAVKLAGHYVCLWRKEKGKWRCYLECWNASPIRPE